MAKVSERRVKRVDFISSIIAIIKIINKYLRNINRDEATHFIVSTKEYVI